MSHAPDRPERRTLPLLMQLAGIIGEEAAVRLAVRFGGQTLYVPNDPPANGELAVSIGLTAAVKLARKWGGTRVEMPLQPAKRTRIIELSLSEKRPPVREIARTVGCTERHVYQVRREYRQGGGVGFDDDEPAIDQRQIDLFSTPPSTPEV